MTSSRIEGLLAKVGRSIAGRSLPEATYRLQFHAGFTFQDACRIVPYLHDLGITHCYASPYLKAWPGSTHGYDVADHRQLNPEVGSDEDYAAWVELLRRHGMTQILDMVPNHMGIAGNENEWWNDVLENGPASPYAGHFDIAWRASSRPELRDRVLLPVLGEPYGKVLEAQQIRLEYSGGAFNIWYFDRRFPVSPCTYAAILGHRLEELQQALGPDAPALHEYQSVLTAVKNLPRRWETLPERVAERLREKEVIKRRLAALVEESEPVRESLAATVAAFNGEPGDPRSFDLLDGLLDEQAYRLSFWRVAADEINYRRFFDINDMAALSMERAEVFAATHERILRLLGDGSIAGLRIDHPDGLYDPRQYLDHLQEQFLLAHARYLAETDPEFKGLEWKEVEGLLAERLAQEYRELSSEYRVARVGVEGGKNGDQAHRPEVRSPGTSYSGLGTRYWPPLYVVVEKILGAGESLPRDCPAHGTSGYDFLNLLNGLFVEAGNAAQFTRLYQEWTQDDTPFTEVVYQKKFLTLRVALSSELHMLAYQLDRLAQKDRWSRDFTLTSLRHALREIIACFPVYRSYIGEHGVSESDLAHVQRAVGRAKARNPAISASVFEFVRNMLLLRYRESSSEADRSEQRHFVGKFQQVTAPVMAKGLEDTAFYVYNRLLSLNEVGGDPARFGVAPAALHRAYQERRDRWPWALSTTSTHDTKRSEDVRARLNVLSELPGEWQQCLARWSRLNEPHRAAVEEALVPDANEEYLLYQTLIGAWPLEPCAPDEYTEFVERIGRYMYKALHEAKVHTSWINPNPAHDEAVQHFVTRILDSRTGQAFLDDFLVFQRKISHYGLFNSLAQTLVKVTAPGVPDTYQGTELWDFSLVDPDNRRPVDYERRRRMLQELGERVSESGPDLSRLARDLTMTKEDGRIKLYVTSRALRLRQVYPGMFATGEYLPLEVEGARQEHAFAFARRLGDQCAVVAVPRLLTRLAPADGQLPLGDAVWQDTRIRLPDALAGRRWRNLFTGEQHTSTSLPLARVFAHFPVALLLG